MAFGLLFVLGLIGMLVIGWIVIVILAFEIEKFNGNTDEDNPFNDLD